MTYQNVTWSAGDEVTSTKLQQMALNEKYLHDNAVSANFEWVYGVRQGSQLAPYGRTVGTYQATKIDGVYVPFDSVTPVLYHLVEVPYPTGYTKPPIITFSISQGQGVLLSGVLVQDGPAAGPAKVLVYSPSGTADSGGVQIRGALNVMLLGK